MKRLLVGLLAVVSACAEAPTEAGTEHSTEANLVTEVVVTPGIPAPAPRPRVEVPGPLLSGAEGAVSSVIGSSSTPAELTPATCSAGSGQQVDITFTITGNQVGTATFKVNRLWEYNGTAWVGSDPTTITQGPKASGTSVTHTVTITLRNASAANSGSLSLTVAPFDLTNSNVTGAKLSLDAGSAAVVAIRLVNCVTTNAPPVLTVPGDLTVEATSSAGAVVTFTVLANDPEDGPLTAICDATSGATFALGTTTVTCSVTDAGGVTVTESFDIKVEDTTGAEFTYIPAGPLTLIAANASGAMFDVNSLGITVADVGGVSEPSTFSCDDPAGYLAIGSTTTVTCIPRDALGNLGTSASFDVTVTLNVSCMVGGFQPPLRYAPDAQSVHKRGSTIPHKFAPPCYADGSPATDLASGLRLELTFLGGGGVTGTIESVDYSAGSTAWVYEDGHYHFNVKTLTSWKEGNWSTAVSYAGIPLASTALGLKK